VKAIWIAAVVAAATVLVAAGPATATPAAGAPDKVQYYLSLGDSLAQGYQPIGGPWSPLGFPGYNQGYADQLLKLARGGYEQLRLVKLGCGGETTTTMIAGSPWCGFAAGSQLAEAESFLHAHRGEIAFVTLDIGGNDVLSPYGGGVAAIHANLPAILDALRAAAGPGVPIVGMSYYSPQFVSWFADPGSLPSLIGALVAFNDVLEGIYADAGDPVADVESAFSSTDTTVVDGLPLDVLRICQWTWLCAPPPHGPDIHPNTAGQGIIAEAFLTALADH
jgi:lysophospholipase L1-like esterase